MTATGRGKRISAKHDVYPTPRWATMRFLEAWEPAHDPRSMHWLEPCAGDGAIVRAVNEFRAKRELVPITWTLIEVRETCREPLLRYSEDVRILDFVDAPPRKLRRLNGSRPYRLDAGDTTPPQLFDAVIMNPAFLLTMEFLRPCRDLGHHVAMLQRQNFIGSEDRNEELRSDMPDQYMIPERVDFAGNGKGDAIGHSWWTWNDEMRVTIGELHLLKTTPLEERRADRPRVNYIRPVPTVAVKTRKRKPRPLRTHEVPSNVGALFR